MLCTCGVPFTHLPCDPVAATKGMLAMDFWDSLWNIIVVFFFAFLFIGAFFALVTIVSDLFRDKNLNGWWKALWLIFLIFVPLLTSLVYLIARGSGMAERSDRAYRKSQEAAEEYIRNTAGTVASPSDGIAKAKALLAEGAITEAEYEALKAHALAAPVAAH